jgi:hypothetical protein
VTAPSNRNESPLLRDALPRLTEMARAIGAELQGSTVSLDGVYDCRANRKAILNRGMTPNIPENPRGRKTPKRGRKQRFDCGTTAETDLTPKPCVTSSALCSASRLCSTS